MSDIFISYAREDRLLAKALASVLEAEGWSVWWDRSIPPGKTWDEVIERELSAARCVIVVWSTISVKSQWVRAEAAEGLKREMLVPVRVDEAELPLRFRQIQTVNLIGWNGEVSHPELATAKGAIASILSPPQQLLTKDYAPAKLLEELTLPVLPKNRTWDDAELNEVNDLRRKYADLWSSISDNFKEYQKATDEGEKEKLYKVHRKRMFALDVIKKELMSHGFDENSFSMFMIPIRWIV